MPENNGVDTPLCAENLSKIGNSRSADGGRDTTTLAVAVPNYDRAALRRSIIHIGVGGFHRAHLAVFIDQLCRAGNRDWAIVGSGILPSDDAIGSVLAAQDNLYTVLVRGPDDTEVSVIGSIVDFVHAYPDPAALTEQIADPDTQIVSLTITEGGYPVDDVTGLYDPASPLAGEHSAFGIMAAGLDLRRRRGIGPLTVLSCDNIVSNGLFARRATLGEAARIDTELAAWIEDEVAFPNSMVDRITPATTDADRQWLLDHTGVDDGWPVVTEPFTQWVLEDAFAGERPPVEDLGVILTDDVEPYERMKLQLLNAGHSCLAYLAALAGHSHVDAAMADPPLHEFFEAFLNREAGPVLPPVAGIDLEDYKRSLVERFSNPAIGDQIARLCLDGSAKFPKFLLPTVRAQLAAGGPVELSALALAGWCHYLQGTADDGSEITPAADPQLSAAVEYAERAGGDPSAFLEFTQVFGDDLPANQRFVAAFTSALHQLRSGGVVATINSQLGEHR